MKLRSCFSPASSAPPAKTGMLVFGSSTDAGAPYVRAADRAIELPAKDARAAYLDVDGMIEAARVACAITGRTVQSHVGIAGPRFAGTPYAQR